MQREIRLLFYSFCGKLIKNKIMKKLLLGAILLFSTLSFVSCNNGIKKSENGELYYLTVKGKNGDETEREVEFIISSNIADSLKISEEQIKHICKVAVLYADWNVKYSPTYKLPETAMIYYIVERNSIIASISGTAENAYGVPNDIRTHIYFTSEGFMREDKDGLPIIESF